MHAAFNSLLSLSFPLIRFTSLTQHQRGPLHLATHKSLTMPLDLVGKLHRTVYITDCPEDAQEDLLHMLLRRCGAVEAWDSAEGRITVVFRSMNSVSNALTFHGLSFVDLTKKICVWKATEAPPLEAKQQLAIQGTSGAPASGAETSAEAEEAEESRRVQRRERRTALQAMLHAEGQAYDSSTPEGRRAALNELCLRQLKALCPLTAAALKDASAELAEKQDNLERLRELVAMKTSEGSSTAEEPPATKARVER